MKKTKSKNLLLYKAFTMAEILLSLAVIGIIAAMTLPTLTANFQDRAFNAKRQALHARLSNAFRMMDYNDYTPIYRTSDYTNYPNLDRFTNELSKMLSIKVIKDSDTIFNNSYNIEYLGATSPLPTAGQPNLFFQTVNGESIGMLFNYPDDPNLGIPEGKLLRDLCFILVYDLNGTKGPNKWGKDLGIMGAFYPDHIQLYAPMPAAITDNIINDSYDPDDSSSQKYRFPNTQVPTLEELYVMLLGRVPSGVVFEQPLCANNGFRTYYSRLMDSGSGDREGDESEGCYYMLITTDGSAPKDGVVIDVPED